MKRLLFIIMTTLMFISCNDDVNIEEVAQKDVSFVLSKASDYSNKNGSSKGVIPRDESIPDCSDVEPAYVSFEVDGEGYDVAVFNIDGIYYTDEVQVSPGSHIVNEFSVYGEDGTLGYVALDENSETASAMEGIHTVPLEFTTESYLKTKVEIDVFCWDSVEPRDLSWFYYEFTPHAIRELAFIGNICTKFYEDFGADGPIFAPAFTVNIYNGSELVRTGSVGLNSGEPLIINYNDNLYEDEDFWYEVILNAPSGDEVIYTASFEDDELINGDGNLVFQIGNCDSFGNNGDTDVVLPAYLPIPDRLSFKLEGPQYDEGYMKLYLKDFDPSGSYAFDETGSEPIGAWCGDKNNSISIGVWYEANVYSSLKLETIPSAYSSIDWGAINWIINNSDGYSNQEIQAAIWYFTNGYGSMNSLANDAISGYIPKPGEDAIVILDPIEGDGQSTLQLFIIQVDP